MKRKRLILGALALTLISFALPKAYAQWFVDLETGLVASGYNDVRIPRDTGTDFSLSEDLKTDSSLFFRFRLGYQIHPRHTISLFVAPLSLHAAGSVNKTINFYEETFLPDTSLKALYRFNSYRLTYRYELLNREKWKLGIGFTAKIRDAAIKVEGDNRSSEKTNVGFVPLLNFRAEWLFSEKFSLLLEADALAAPQGRAEDVLLAIELHLNKNFAFRAGYRILEGGADVEEVYNFALLHFAAVGTTIRF
jgi:hypothetical protein